MKKRVIVVLGMHRSGTSALMKAIESVGIDIGNKFLPAAKDNPKGFFEDQDINLLNIEMLIELGHDWHHLRFLTAEDIKKLVELGYKEKAVNILKTKLESSNFFGFKDPRVSKLIEFWKLVFVELDCEITWVYSVRNPFSVAKSLETRNGFSIRKSYLLWLSYNISAITSLEKHAFIVVDYDDLVTDPGSQIRRIASYLSVEPGVNAVEEFSSQFIDTSLRHSHGDLESLLGDPGCPRPSIELFKLLLSSVKHEIINVSNMPTLFEFCKKSYVDMTSSFQLLDEMAAEINHQRGEIAALKNEVTANGTKWISLLENTPQPIEIKLYPGVLNDASIFFSEENSASATYFIGEGLRTVTLEFEFDCKNPLNYFRFDVADAPCFIQLYSMQLQEKDGQPIWKWDSQSDEIPWDSCKDIHLIRHTFDDGLYMASHSDDPQLYLNIKNLLSERSCKSVVFTARLSISSISEHSKQAISTLTSIRKKLLTFQKYDLETTGKDDNTFFLNFNLEDLIKTIELKIEDLLQPLYGMRELVIGQSQLMKNQTARISDVELSVNAAIHTAKEAVESTVKNAMLPLGDIRELNLDQTQLIKTQTNHMFEVERSINDTIRATNNSLLNNFENLVNSKTSELVKLKEELGSLLFSLSKRSELAHELIEKQYADLKAEVNNSQYTIEKMVDMIKAEQEKSSDRDVLISQLKAALSETQLMLAQYKDAYELLIKSRMVQIAVALSGKTTKILLTK